MAFCGSWTPQKSVIPMWHYCETTKEKWTRKITEKEVRMVDRHICSMRYTIMYLSEWQKYKNLTLSVDKIQDLSYDAYGNFIVFIQLVFITILESNLAKCSKIGDILS